jgi:hypothetical protein
MAAVPHASQLGAQRGDAILAYAGNSLELAAIFVT